MNAAVGKENLSLADAAGIKDDLPGSRITGVIFVADLEIIVAERDPDPLAAPADMNDMALEGQTLEEGFAGLRGQFGFESGAENERAGSNFEIGHGVGFRLLELLSTLGYSGRGGPARGAFALLRRKVLPIASRSGPRGRKYSISTAIGISSPGWARL